MHNARIEIGVSCRYLLFALVPGMVEGARVIQTGSTHFKLAWLPPLVKNGVIIGYSVSFKKGLLSTFVHNKYLAPI